VEIECNKDFVEYKMFEFEFSFVPNLFGTLHNKDLSRKNLNFVRLKKFENIIILNI